MARNSNALAANAFRIYLTYMRQETETLLVDYRLRQRISVSAVEKSHWGHVVDAAQRVVLYITNCTQDYQSNFLCITGMYGLCAISAAQDALASFVVTAELSYISEIFSLKEMYTQMERTFRAKCIVNAIVALNDGDTDVSALWVDAAQQIQLMLNRRHSEEPAKDWSVKVIPELVYVSNASALSASAAVQASPEVAELQKRAVHNYRLCAVHAVLGRKTNYQHAATTFETASTYSAQAFHCSDAFAQQLWQRASNSMQLAAELVESQALTVLTTNDIAVDEKISIAKDYSADAEFALSESVYLSSLKDKCLVAKCKTAAALPVWQAQVAAFETVRHRWETVKALRLACADRDAALLILEQYNSAKSDLAAIFVVADELEVNIEKAAYYRSKAVNFHHINEPRLRDLWHQCWNDAAQYADDVVHFSVYAIQNGKVCTLPPDIELQRQLSHSKSHACANGVSNMLASAVRASDLARGAERKRRDAREAVWFRAQSEYCLQATRRYLEDVTNTAAVASSLNDLPVSQATLDLVDLANLCVNATTYLSISIAVREEPVQQEWTAQVSELYMLAANLSIAATSLNEENRERCQGAVALCLALITILVEKPNETSGDVIVMMERGCDSARKFLAAQAHDWLLYLVEMCSTFAEMLKAGDHPEFTIIAKAYVALVLRTNGTGVAHESDNIIDRYVIGYASIILAEALELLNANKRAAYCRVEVAKRVCKIFADPQAVPVELMSLPGTATAGRLEALLQEHAVACGQHLVCMYHVLFVKKAQRDDDAWTQAEDVAALLISSYKDAEITCIDFPSGYAGAVDQYGLIALRQASLRCYMAAVRSSANVWDEAVAVCKEVANVQASYHVRATALIERYASAAKAWEVNDTELHAAHTSAAKVAREAFQNLQNNVTDRQVSDEYLLKAADRRVLALQAYRRGQGELAAVHNQAADLLREVADYALPLQDWDAWAVLVQHFKRTVLLTLIAELEARAAALSAQALAANLPHDPQNLAAGTNSSTSNNETPALAVASGWRQRIAEGLGWH